MIYAGLSPLVGLGVVVVVLVVVDVLGILVVAGATVGKYLLTEGPGAGEACLVFCLFASNSDSWNF